MAKKSRRARRQTIAPPQYTPSPTVTRQAPDLPATLQTEQTVAKVSASHKQVDFRSEYRYVINDLRSMAIIAVAMLAVLIALSFLIR